jgi:hypothetical protein
MLLPSNINAGLRFKLDLLLGASGLTVRLRSAECYAGMPPGFVQALRRSAFRTNLFVRKQAICFCDFNFEGWGPCWH